MTAADWTDRRDIGTARGDALHPVMREMVDAMRERGATFMRVTLIDERNEFVLEGWLEQPDDQGPEPT
jgi:hypothetical protein